jgi:tRNA G18 (ribose-2'-O)-methylase SpoU
MKDIVVIAHDIRSVLNVGAICRSAECFGAKAFFCTGYTPYIYTENDDRPPHVRLRLERDMKKTALGVEKLLPPTHHPDVFQLIENLRSEGFIILALEQHTAAIPLPSFNLQTPAVLLLGNEPKGLPVELLSTCDKIIEIPQAGKKESLNVSVAAGIALYQLRNLLQ